MKTETNSNNDVIWTSNVELPQLSNEECFPVIGDCQVSSILSTLDTISPEKIIQNNADISQTMDLIVVQNSDYKITQNNVNNKTPNDFLLLKDSISQQVTFNNSKPSFLRQTKRLKKECGDDDCENMLYFVCNLCPYLCIKDSKITEHLEKEHKDKNSSLTKPPHLKCPACPNIFYNKMPLRSHLIYDHKVSGASDLRKIIQAVLYFSKKSLNNSDGKATEGNKDNNFSTPSISCKNEMDLKYIEKLISTDKIINDDSLSNVAENALDISHESMLGKSNSKDSKETERGIENRCMPEIVSLPMIDITHNDPEKTFRTIIKKKPDSLARYLDQKKLHKCSVTTCKVRLHDSSKMTYHINCHIDTSFKCPECNDSFAFWKPLTGHLWRTHKIDMELYSCDKCDYKTFSLGKLNNIHKLIHSDLKSFVCEVCQKAFKNSKQLRNHRTTHKEKSEKLIHACDLCTKSFADRRQLRIHMDGVHKKIKPFLCSYCGYKGASKSALTMHIRQHTGEKPFTCDSCNYATADHNSIRKHKLRHTGQKPYKCLHCDYACIQSTTYKVHLWTKHPGLEKDALFTCQHCQFKTINHNMYLSHLATVHK